MKFKRRWDDAAWHAMSSCAKVTADAFPRHPPVPYIYIDDTLVESGSAKVLADVVAMHPQ